MKDFYTRELFKGLELDQAYDIQKNGSTRSGKIEYFREIDTPYLDFTRVERPTRKVSIIHVIGNMAIDRDIKVVIVGAFDDQPEGYITETDFENIGKIDIFPDALLAETEYHLRYGDSSGSNQPS